MADTPSRTDKETLTLSNFWGWHFHAVLKDLRRVLDKDLSELAKKLDPDQPLKLRRLIPSDRIELFRRSWPGPEHSRFWFGVSKNAL